MLDGTVQFLAIDDERPRALLESEAEAIRAWAEGNRRDVRATVGTVLDVRALETVTDALGRTPPTARLVSRGWPTGRLTAFESRATDRRTSGDDDNDRSASTRAMGVRRFPFTSDRWLHAVHSLHTVQRLL